MDGTATFSPLNIFRALTGPIFDKELRVGSRRKRYYVLRSLYLLMLAVLVAITWYSRNASLGFGRSVYSTSRMSEVGRMVIISVAWFQFFLCQLAAVLFFSNSICEEMNRGTLNVLMTTPITSLQIVMGKFFSKLIQLALVLSLSLSTLSVIYVFGGVHWSFIISSYCVTLSAVIFAGALTMFFSGWLKRPYRVIFLMIILLSIFCSLGPSFIRLLVQGSGGGQWFLLVNPMAAMLEITRPGITGVSVGGTVFAWWKHCGVMLGLSGLLLGLTTIRLRKSMLTFAFESTVKKKGVLSRMKHFLFGGGAHYPMYLKGVSSRKFFTLPGVLLAVFMIVGYGVSYFCMSLGLNMGFAMAVSQTYMLIVWLVVFLRTIVGASTSITREKENRSLSALLCCPMKDGQIVIGKAKQVFWDNRIAWCILLLNAAVSIIILQLFVYKGQNINVPGGMVVQSIVSVLGICANLIFVLGFGVYLSVRLKSSTSAVVSGLAGYLVWYVIRYMLIVIPVMVLHNTSYYILVMISHPIADLVVGVWFLWRAKCLLRRYAFV